ncbi:hypothetical protein Tco_0750417 [Tanacetum coccineum]|uniref:Synaptobrevin, longin-like domain protein n=1 Tax=Tanacetum coccineum TaxID=301880 RepID=A0ABQ4Z2M3_9ASTR
MENGLAIHMLTEKKYPLSQEMISKMLKKKLEVDHESSQAIELLRDCYEKRLIDVVKIHTDNNIADLLPKGFDVTRFNFLVMTTLKYSDKHNMVAFLKKPNESVGFTEIVDFLKGTSLRYALTHNPTIYDSLVKQFWQTATVRTLANGTPELVASIDNKEYTITEASVRSKLQLADAAGISNLPDAEIYDGLATLGYVSEGKLTFWKKNFTPQWKFLIHTILHCLSPKSGGWDQFGSPIATALICLSSNRVQLRIKAKAQQSQLNPNTPTDPDIEIPQSYGPTFTHVADEATTIGVRVGTEGATTTTSGLDAGLDSGNIHESPLKIANLEKELYQTKTTYGKAVLTLVERVKSLEVALKRKTKKVVVSDSEDEETENQGRKIQDIDNDPLVSLVRESMKEKDTNFVTPTKISALGEVQEQNISPTTLEAAKTLSRVISQKAKSTDKGKRYKRKTRSKLIKKDISTDLDAGIEVNPGSKDFNTGNEDFNTGSLGVSTGSGPVSTSSVVQTINVTIPSPIKSQREGKAPMATKEIQATKRTKAHIQQEEASLTEAMRLQALQEEEAARQVHLDALLAKRISEEEELSEQQKKRKAEVQEAA